MAAECFARKSYPAATMNDIALACGTSKARLYHYYDSKEAILFDLLDRYTQRLLAIIGQAEATAQRRGLDERARCTSSSAAFCRSTRPRPHAMWRCCTTRRFWAMRSAS